MRRNHDGHLPLKKQETVFDQIENLVVLAASKDVTRDQIIEQLVEIDSQLRLALSEKNDLGAQVGLTAEVGASLLRGLSDVYAQPIRMEDLKAVQAIGMVVDATLDAQPDYHYAAHFYNVALVNTVLGVISEKKLHDQHYTMPEVSRKVVVGLLHDLYHTGGNNQYFVGADGVQNSVYRPFYFEDLTIEKSADLLERVGYDKSEIKEIQLAILGTEPRTGPALLSKAQAFHDATTDEARREVRAQAYKILVDAYTPMKDEAVALGRAQAEVDFMAPSALKMDFFDRLFVDKDQMKSEALYRVALDESKKFLATCDQLTSADLAFSLITPDAHAINTAQFQNEFDASGVKGLVLIEDGALHLGGTSGFLIYVADIPVVNNEVQDKPHRNKSVNYLLTPSFVATAKTVIYEAVNKIAMRFTPKQVKGHKAVGRGAENRDNGLVVTRDMCSHVVRGGGSFPVLGK